MRIETIVVVSLLVLTGCPQKRDAARLAQAQAALAAAEAKLAKLEAERAALVKQVAAEKAKSVQAKPAWMRSTKGADKTLVRGLGLRPGDKIISVNGQPVGVGAQDGDPFAQLKGERRFAVEVERDGKRMVLTFNKSAPTPATEPAAPATKPAAPATPGPSMCSACKKMNYTADVGNCSLKLQGCRGWTSSGAFKHCEACARVSKTCQACKKDL